MRKVDDIISNCFGLDFEMIIKDCSNVLRDNSRYSVITINDDNIYNLSVQMVNYYLFKRNDLIAYPLGRFNELFIHFKRDDYLEIFDLLEMEFNQFLNISGLEINKKYLILRKDYLHGFGVEITDELYGYLQIPNSSFEDYIEKIQYRLGINPRSFKRSFSTKELFEL